MVLSGKEILDAAEFVKEHGENKEYSLGNPIPYMNAGYKRYISVKGDKNKKDIADYNMF